VVEIVDRAGDVVARGISGIDADALRAVRGRRTADLPAHVVHEAVHRDDLMLMA